MNNSTAMKQQHELSEIRFIDLLVAMENGSEEILLTDNGITIENQIT